MSKNQLYKDCNVEDELYKDWVSLLENFSKNSSINYLQEYYSFQNLTIDEIWNKFDINSNYGEEEKYLFFKGFLTHYNLYWQNDISCIEYEYDDFGIKKNPNINAHFLPELIKQAKSIEDFFLDESITFKIDDEQVLFHLNLILFLKQIHQNLVKQQYTMLFLDSGDAYEVFYCRTEISQIIPKYLATILAIEESDILNVEQFYSKETTRYKEQCDIIAQSYEEQSIINLSKLKK